MRSAVAHLTGHMSLYPMVDPKGFCSLVVLKTHAWHFISEWVQTDVTGGLSDFDCDPPSEGQENDCIDWK